VISIKVFISYKWEDKKYANGLDGLLNNPNNDYRHLTEREREDLRYKGESSVKDYLKDKIRDRDAIICLIGNNTHNSTGVKYELQVAKSLGKKIIGVRIQQTKGSLPPLLKKWGIKETPWNSREINDVLRF